MPVPPGWNAATAIAGCPVIHWNGRAWRFHKQKYPASDPGGSLRVSGRYHRGLDQFPEDQVWPALYLALGPEVSVGEILRHLSSDQLPLLNDYRLSELAIKLTYVVDGRDASVLGLTTDDLCHDTDYRVTQGVAEAALAVGAEGILVPSATRLGNNLVVFPTQLRTESRIAVVESVDPRLYVSR